jgi:SAM-dependent methyltransferase
VAGAPATADVDPVLYDSIRRLEETNWWFVGMRAIARSLMAGLPRFERALDVGCGSGGNLGLLRSVAREVYALDLSDRALAYLRERGVQDLAGLIAADGQSLPVRSDAFDLIWMFNVVEHLPDDRAALREMARALRPGGWAVVATSASPLLWSDHDVANHHHRRYRAEELRDRMGAAGLRVRRMTHANAALFAPTAVVATAQRIRARLWGRPRYEHNAVDVPPRVDRLLRGVLEAEARWLSRHDLPVGVSLFALAERA